MKPGGGHAKGAAFERDTCKKLSMWISDGKRDDLLWRTAMSGGRATVQMKIGITNNAQAGDIASIDPASAAFIRTFLVECKHYADLNLLSGVLKTKGTLCDFWFRLKKEALKYNRIPLLIAKQNLYPTMVITTGPGARKIARSVSPMADLPHWNAGLYLFDQVLEKPHDQSAYS